MDIVTYMLIWLGGVAVGVILGIIIHMKLGHDPQFPDEFVGGIKRPSRTPMPLPNDQANR